MSRDKNLWEPQHYTWVFTHTPTRLLTAILPDKLARRGYAPKRGEGYLYAEGQLPVLLVAHVDTVFGLPPSEDEIFYDGERQVLWSPAGLGADDRAGVLGIIQLLQRGFRPHVLFLDGEEKCCEGAWSAVADMDAPDVRYIVELDRRGKQEAVFYGCVNERFERYVLSFGFKRAEGTYTDISVLCPKWGIAGVNLSCGYHEAHSLAEYLVLPDLDDTLRRVCAMLKNVPRKTFRYVGAAVPVLSKPAPPAEAAPEFGWTADDDTLYEERTVDLDPAVLVTLYGGTEAGWARWLDNHAQDLVRVAEDAIFDFIDGVCASGLPFDVSN